MAGDGRRPRRAYPRADRQSRPARLRSAVGQRLPADVRDVIAKNLNKSALDQRADIFKQNETFKADLTSKGMEFIKVDPKPFREKLQAAGFYKEWKGKYGDEAWAALEKYTGPIS